MFVGSEEAGQKIEEGEKGKKTEKGGKKDLRMMLLYVARR